MKRLVYSFLTACTGGIIALGSYKMMEENKNFRTVETQVPDISFSKAAHIFQAVQGSAGVTDFTVAAAMVTPAVVHIKTTYTQSARGGQLFLDPFGMFDDFFGSGRGYMEPSPRAATGSGVIISQDGYIITNNHVIDRADEIEVVLDDKRSFKGTLIGGDANTDLALIKIEENNLPYLKYGNSDNVKVGEWVLAVGNPFNLTSTVTAGIISAKARNIGILGNRNDPDSRPIEAFIQTDAAINPGNSGGALVNTNGELIGINAAIASKTGSYEGYGFAIPSNLTQKVISDILNYGIVQRGYLGISYRENNATLAKEKDINIVTGIYVEEVLKEGAAASAGIKKGDLIIRVNGILLRSGSDLQEQIGMARPGDEVDLVILRGKEELKFKVVLKNADNKSEIVRAVPNENFDALGAKFIPLSDNEKKKYSLSAGMKVASVTPNGAFAKSDISSGFVVLKVNGKIVNNEKDIKAALNYTKNSMVSIEGIYPNDLAFKYRFIVPVSE